MILPNYCSPSTYIFGKKIRHSGYRPFPRRLPIRNGHVNSFAKSKKFLQTTESIFDKPIDIFFHSSEHFHPIFERKFDKKIGKIAHNLSTQIQCSFDKQTKSVFSKYNFFYKIVLKEL